ncbi:hypothetical protein [Rhizobium sp. MHM7A]|uniref:hypothetical protein n=1 Tax=Rhizobium sp. MHM7A TaxID=2583233 RepID=UPI001105D0F1|nr:hypothetical protein [Rhizobium sp. MHM7A]TLX08081.1 hypothetical protein FFR93_29505 [Rhizobium sp. MHM7A]
MIGELIGAGATLLGGLFGSKKPKKEKTQTTTTNVSSVDYQKMVDSARAAGFNPLTALRNGGAAGFSTSTSTSNSTTTVPTTSALPGALQSVGGILGQALSSKIDPVAAGRRQMDTALVDYQLRRGDRQPGTLYPGSTYAGTKMGRQLMPAVGPSTGKVAASPATMANPRGYDLQPAKQTKLFGEKPGSWWQHHPLVPDGQTFEDVYGEHVGQIIGAPIKLVADLGWNMARAERHVKRYTDPYVLGFYDKVGKWWERTAPKVPTTAAQRFRGWDPLVRPRNVGGGGW